MSADDTQKVLSSWIERDLSADAATGKLAHAFGVDDALGRIEESLTARRYPVLVGDPGVGKTAIVHELARRVARAARSRRAKRGLGGRLQRRSASPCSGVGGAGRRDGEDLV